MALPCLSKQTLKGPLNTLSFLSVQSLLLGTSLWQPRPPKAVQYIVYILYRMQWMTYIYKTETLQF